MKEQLRYIYDLTPESLVIDVGGYEGMFGAKIHQMYACDVSIYEPEESSYQKCMQMLGIFPPLKIFKKGIGNSNRYDTIYVNGDRTGVFSTGEKQIIEIVDIKDVIGSRNIDLIKLNIEGMEYELLERVIECDLQTKLKNIQVQFHDYAPDYIERYEKIRDKLLLTHELTFDYPFLWQNFRLKDKSVV